MPQLPDHLKQLCDAGVTLRPHRDTDLPRMAQACRDLDTRRWLPLPAPYTESDARSFVAAMVAGADAGTRFEWAVECSGQWVGNIGLHDRRGDTFEVGFLVHPDARGSRICTRALRLLAGYALDDLGFEGLTWRAARGNFASRRVAWSCGFTVDGSWPVPHQVSDRGSVDGMWLGHLAADHPRRPTRSWFEPPVLDGGRFVLRPWRADDVPRSEQDALSALMVHDMQPGADAYADWLLTRRERMAHGSGIYWCIADPDIDEPLGHVQVQGLDVDFTRGTGEVGYWLYPAARGLGLLQEVLDLVIAHAFASLSDLSGGSGLGLHRLRAGTDLANRASARALRRAGFRQVAHERAVLAHVDRAPSGALTFELLADDDRLTQSIEPAVIATLRTERLVLRPWADTDRPAEEVELDRAALRYMPPGAQPTYSSWTDWFERRARQVDCGQLQWCIADARTDVALGSVALFDRDAPVSDRAEIGYWLYQEARGHGYAGEAIDAVLAHAYASPATDGLGLTRVAAETDAENLPSQKLLRSRGFHQWGYARENYTRADNSVSDSSYFELLARDYEPTRS